MQENINKTLKSLKARGETWEERRDNIFELMDKKLETARQLQSVKEDLESGRMGSEEALKKIEELGTNLEGKTTPETIAQYQILEELSRKMEELKIKFDQFEKEEYENRNHEFEEEIFEEYKKYEKEAEEMRESNPPLDFFATVKHALGYFKDCLLKVDSYKHDPALAFRDLAEAHEINYDLLKSELKTEKIVFTPLSINLILEKGCRWLKNHESEDGEALHTRGTVINVISGEIGERAVETMIKHENEHVVLEGFQGHFKSPGLRLTTLELALDPDIFPSEIAIARKKVVENAFGIFDADKMLDASHNEIRAALAQSPELIEYFRSAVREKIRSKAENTSFSLSASEGMEVLNILSTAGSQIQEALALLAQGQSSDDPELSSACERIKDRYFSMFLKAMGDLGHAYFIADHMDDSAKTDVALLTYLLRPSQWHNILKFLLHKNQI